MHIRSKSLCASSTRDIGPPFFGKALRVLKPTIAPNWKSSRKFTFEKDGVCFKLDDLSFSQLTSSQRPTSNHPKPHQGTSKKAHIQSSLQKKDEPKAAMRKRSSMAKKKVKLYWHTSAELNQWFFLVFWGSKTKEPEVLRSSVLPFYLWFFWVVLFFEPSPTSAAGAVRPCSYVYTVLSCCCSFYILLIILIPVLYVHLQKGILYAL